MAARMIDLIKDPATHTWTAEQFRVKVGCKSRSTITNTAAWKQLAVARESARLQKAEQAYERTSTSGDGLSESNGRIGWGLNNSTLRLNNFRKSEISQRRLFPEGNRLLCCAGQSCSVERTERTKKG